MFVVEADGAVSDPGNASDDGTTGEDVIAGLAVMEDGIELKDSALIGSELDKIWVCDSDNIAESLMMDCVATRDDNGSSVSAVGTLADEVKATEENDTGTTVEGGKFDSDGIVELWLAEVVNSACEVDSKIGAIDESLETIGYKDDVSSVMEAIEDVSEFADVSVGFSIMLSELLECEVSNECSVDVKSFEEDDQVE